MCIRDSYITDRPYGNESTKLVDLNGDGLPDLLYNLWIGDGVTRANAWLNTGSGWVNAPAYAPPYPMWSRGVDDEGMKLIDLNGDGLPDIVRSIWAGAPYRTAWINTGSGWREAPEYAAPYYITDRPYGNESTQFVDLNLSLIHISEPTRLLSISYAVFCLKKKKKQQ